MSVTYRDSTVADAAGLAAAFRESFCETFGDLYRAEDLSAFLEQHSEWHWREQLEDAGFAVRVASEGERIAGFAKLGPLRLPVAPAAAAIELRQFYVLKRWQGTGIASALMDWVLEEARSRRAAALYLSVYTENHRARRFYARYGLEEVGPYAFMVGTQADEDVMMKLKL